MGMRMTYTVFASLKMTRFPFFNSGNCWTPFKLNRTILKEGIEPDLEGKLVYDKLLYLGPEYAEIG